MARSSGDSQNKVRAKKTIGMLGVSLSLAGGGCATSGADAATLPATSNVRTIDLMEEEVFDVGLSSFRLFNREEPQDMKAVQLAWWRGCRGCWGWRGCRGCGCRGCGCRGCGCRGCRGCGA